MKNRLLIIISFFFPLLCQANEMFSVPPVSYAISGNDRYGEKAYEINAELKYYKADIVFKSLKIKIYDKSFEIDKKLLAKARNPNFGSISVINDAGVFGSYFYIGIPYGKAGKCKEFSKIYISSLETMDGKGLTAKLYDPCKKP